MWYVYMLKSEKDKKHYIGSTNDLKRRLQQHINSENNSTKYRLPLELIYYEAYLSEAPARLRERKLKIFGSAYYELKKRIPEMN